MSTINLYPPSAFDVYNNKKLTFSSGCDKVCEEIKRACKGVGTNEAMLIKMLGNRSPNERALIAYRFKELFHEELKDQLKSETSGDFGFLLQLLAVPLPAAEAYILHKATAGAGTSEELIYPIIMGRTNEELQILRKTFYEIYQKDLAVVLDSELSGDFKTVIMTALQAPVVEYKASFHTAQKAEEDVDKIYKAGEGKWGTDEEGFVRVLFASPPKHIQTMNEIYAKKHKHGLAEAAKGEFSGDAGAALVFHIRLALEPTKALAEYFESTMKGVGTDERGLASAIVRYHAYVKEISATYEALYKTTLTDRIKGEVSGDYGELLLKELEAPSA